MTIIRDILAWLMSETGVHHDMPMWLACLFALLALVVFGYLIPSYLHITIEEGKAAEAAARAAAEVVLEDGRTDD